MKEPSEAALKNSEWDGCGIENWSNPRLIEIDSFRHDSLSIDWWPMVYEPEHDGLCYWAKEGVESVPITRNGLMVSESEYDDVHAKVIIMDLDSVVVAKSDLADFGDQK